MKLKLEKEVCWENGKSVTKYWIYVDERVIDIAWTEEEAMEKYENVKANYIASSKQVIKEETL